MCYHHRVMKRPNKLTAVILTGSRDSHGPLTQGMGIQSKAMLPILGRPMVAYVLDAIAESHFSPEIYVSTADPDVLALTDSVPFQGIPSEDQAVRSMLGALSRLPDAEWVLFVSGDHPLLTPEMINHFVTETLERDLTFSVAAVRRSVVNASYLQSRRTYFPVKGDAYSGGNLFLINRRKFHGRAGFMETIDKNRKKPWKSLAMLNPFIALLILLRQMDIHGVARYASKVFGCETGVVDMPFAECCMDVDKPSDKEIAEMILRRRQEGEIANRPSLSSGYRQGNRDAG